MSFLNANQEAADKVIIEIKLSMNERLFQNGVITEEMYTQAKAIILRGA